MQKLVDSDLIRRIRAVRLVVFDFDGVFTDNSVLVSQDGTEFVRCSRADGIGLRKLDRLGIAYFVLSTETNPVVTARAKKLQVECIQGCDDKRSTLQHMVQQRGLSLEQVAFVGNDINDLSCLEIVGLPMVVRDAHPDVLGFGAYRSRRRGGYGAVREICDLFAKILDPSGGVTRVYG